MREFAQNEASQSAEEEVRKIEGAGAKVEMLHVAVGHPDSEILRIAEEIGADLVVVGSRGLGPLRRALMRVSKASSVTPTAPCSLCVARTATEVTCREESSSPSTDLRGRTEPSGSRQRFRPPRARCSTSCESSRPNSTGPTQDLSTGRVGRLTSSAPSVKSRPFWTNARGAYGPRGSRLATPILRSAIRTKR